MRAMQVLIRRTIVGILLLPAVVIVADATASSSTTRLDDHSTAYTPPLRSRKSHPRLNTDINMTLSLTQQSLQQQQLLTRPLSPEELEEERQARKRRSLERKARMRQAFADIPPPPKDSMEPVSQDEFHTMQQNIKQQQQQQQNTAYSDSDNSNSDRKLSWFGRSSNSGISTVSETYLVDPSQAYDKWAQAYRMLGGYIDCDYKKEGDDHHSGDNNNNNNNGDDDPSCSRWMIWASYVNPNYQGDGYYEYFGDDATGVLDCHSPDTEWQLLGVYRQEFYQYIEQISKHLWAIDEYEYVVALAGLAYMTDSDCFGVGYDSNGNYIYAGVAPQPYGKFEMALYTDTYCLEPDTSLGKTYDDFGLQSDVDLGSKDATDDDGKSWAYDWWYDTQEYTLTQLNDVYEEYKYCTSCVDYPTYQDGYYIGDYGTDDDDLINQCWKFWSHNSYTCEAQCIEKANAQGTILSIQYGDTVYGRTSSSFYSKDSSSRSSEVAESPLARLLANAFLTLSFLLFVATFLAFAVARRSRYRESRSSRSRRLLDGGEDGDNRSRRSRRSKSQVRSSTRDGDGLFKTSAGGGGGTASRSKSGSGGGGGGDRGKSSSASRRSVRSSSNRSRKSSRRGKSYDPPKGERGDREHHSSSRKHSKAPDDEFF